jgi:putative nucleotidyltransferase with HDIG domain
VNAGASHDQRQARSLGEIDTIGNVGSLGYPKAVRILVVDDELPALKLLCLILSAPNFQCTGANSGKEALATLKLKQFDAIVSDLRMPGMDGMELLVEARRLDPHVAFVLTTGVDDVEVGVRAMRAGADDYLVKPVLECAVLASLERSLDKKRLEREVENYRHHLEAMVEERTGQLQGALQQIERNYENTLQALGAAIDLRDHATAGHSYRVSHYSIEIASVMALPSLQVINIARGAYLHDIGKLGIPDHILLKPGPLTVEERRLMQQHVQIGFDIVSGIPFLADAAEIILTHHERFDGSGYPRGLKGEQIAVGGRIFAIADTLDAITSDRPYHRAAPFESGLETIHRLAGTQFDPQMVEEFLKVDKETWPTIARNERDMSG